MIHALRKEFQVKYISYNYPNERVFYCCQWRWPRPVYVIIRALLAVYMVYGVIHNIVDYFITNCTECDNKDIVDNYINRTSAQPRIVLFSMWSYILLTLHTLWSAVLSFVFYTHINADIYELKFQRPRINTHATNQTDQPNVPSADAPTENRKHSGNRVSFESNGQNQDIATSHQHVNANQGFLTSSDEYIATDLDTCSTNVTELHEPIRSRNTSTTQSVDEKESSHLGKRHSTYESFSRFQQDMMWVHTPFYFRLSWCLANLAASAAPISTIMFFVILHPRMDATQSEKLNINNININIMNFVLVAADQVISAQPIRLLHVISPVLYWLLYVVFSVIYWSTDNANHVAYPVVLDWNSPGIAVGFTLGVALVVLPLIQMILFGIFQLKNSLHKYMYGCSFSGDVD